MLHKWAPRLCFLLYGWQDQMPITLVLWCFAVLQYHVSSVTIDERSIPIDRCPISIGKCSIPNNPITYYNSTATVQFRLASVQFRSENCIQWFYFPLQSLSWIYPPCSIAKKRRIVDFRCLSLPNWLHVVFPFRFSYKVAKNWETVGWVWSWNPTLRWSKVGK